MNVINKLTGEILDLKFLWRTPRTKRPVKRYQPSLNRQDHLLFTTILATLALAVVMVLD